VRQKVTRGKGRREKAKVRATVIGDLVQDPGMLFVKGKTGGGNKELCEFQKRRFTVAPNAFHAIK
jgi:hypothetical protein